MQINRAPRYKNNLFQILDYIAQDKLSASENIRDMVYKGHTVIYRVNEAKNTIDIVRMFHKNKPPLKK